MGRRLYMQPNGLYGLWSTVVDDFVELNASLLDVKEHIMMDEYGRISLYQRKLEKETDEEERENYQYVIDQKRSLLEMEFDQWFRQQMKDQDLASSLGMVAVIHGKDVAAERIEEMGGTWAEYEATINRAIAEAPGDE